MYSLSRFCRIASFDYYFLSAYVSFSLLMSRVVCLSLVLFACLPFCLPVLLFVYLSPVSSACLSFYLPIFRFIYLSFVLSACPLVICQSVCLQFLRIFSVCLFSPPAYNCTCNIEILSLIASSSHCLIVALFHRLELSSLMILLYFLSSSLSLWKRKLKCTLTPLITMRGHCTIKGTGHKGSAF